jgi:cystathionine gamma-synthase
MTKFRADRIYSGAVPGNFESWLLLRSLRSLKVRVTHQSNSAAAIVAWLTSKSEPCLAVIDKVWHASLPDHPGHEASKRQGSGWSGVFSVEV